MKIKILLSVVLCTALIKTVNAQSANDHPPVQNHQITEPLSIINQLQPVALDPAIQNGAKKMYGFDVSGMEQILPGVMRRETIWIPKGKNYQTTAKRMTIDYEQLVPLLVAALKEQQSQLTALEFELEHIKMHLRHSPFN
jgi:hypothetical protein